MEQAKEKLKFEIVCLEKAIGTLKLALSEPMNDIVRDAVIQRFEYVFELSWKTMQTAAGYMGNVCNSPREAIKGSFKMGWLENADDWLEAMEARNKTSHTYNEKLANEVYEVARKFPPLAESLLALLKKVF
jgi:nucleotidyltransferase substrate binding protein (TIGR01987 family)